MFAMPTVNPIQEQGLVNVNAGYDESGVKRDVANNRLKPSMYGGVSDSVFNLAPASLAFTVPGSSTSKGRVAVRDALNAIAGDAAYTYKDSPDMFVEAVRNRIQFIGVTAQQLDTGPLTKQLGVSVTICGLKTLEKAPDGENIVTGDLLFADLPSPNSAPPNSGSVQGEGISAAKYTLVLRRASAASPGLKLRRHIRAILDDPRQWQAAMGRHLQGTKLWATAAHQIMTSYLVGVVFGARTLMARGILQPTAVAGTRLFGVVLTDPLDAYAAALVAPAGNDDLAPLADAAATKLAVLYGLLPGSKTAPLQGRLDRTDAFDSGILLLRETTLQTIFYDGTHVGFEFGHTYNAGTRVHTFAARTDTKSVVNTATDAGKMLTLQLTHQVRSTASAWAAQLQFMRFLVGKATSPANKSTPQLNVMLGLCRP